jgi:hypothetical protein
VETDIAVILTGLLASSLLMGTLGLRRALTGMGLSFDVELRQRMVRALRRIMPLLMRAAVVATGLTTCFRETPDSRLADAATAGVEANLAARLDTFSPGHSQLPFRSRVSKRIGFSLGAIWGQY